MKKKIIIFGTIMLAIIVVLSSCSSSISTNNVEDTVSTENVIITVNQFYGNKPRTIETEVSIEYAEEIEQMLINLNEAITNNDEIAISYYEEQLNNKGIFGNNYQEFYSNDEFTRNINLNKASNFLNILGNQNDDNISNSLCYFNALGKGLMVSYLGVVVWEAFQRLLGNASSYLEALVIIIIFLPFVLTTVILTGLIPFRVAMPRGIVYVEEGTISSLGLKGFKRLKVETEPATVNISWFTGLSISIPGNEETGRDPFLFVSGLAIDVKEYET